MSELEKFDLNVEDLIKIHKESFDVKIETNLLTDSKHQLVTFMFSWLNLPKDDRIESGLQIALTKSSNECEKDENSNEIISLTILNQVSAKKTIRNGVKDIHEKS